MKLFGKIGTTGCELSASERERYSRQIMLDDNGEQAQRALKNAAVLVVGAGGLGSAVLPYLVGAGVGRIGIVDDDVISLSNLQRQILYETSHIGQSKAERATERVSALNPEIRIDTYNTRFTSENAIEILTPYQLIIDCTDNIPARHVIDHASRETRKPFIYGSLCEYTGQISVFNYRNAPAYADIFPRSSETKPFTQSLGVFGAIAGIVGSIQAMEAIKILIGAEDTLAGHLLLIDMRTYGFRKVKMG